MKTTFFRSLLLSAVILAAVFSSSAYAANPKLDKENKIFLKLSEQVEKADPHDWLTYASCAEKLIQNKTHMTDAYVWIMESLSINTDTYNLLYLEIIMLLIKCHMKPSIVMSTA